SNYREGRLKHVHEQRPKLSTLNSASSVKKWIPSIKNEIEYYLQQSQLSHYPERKIAEFQLHIEALEKEYKRFITKLRVLDPSCKHKPWTPRAYCKRRADQQDSPCTVKIPRHSEIHDDNTQLRAGKSDLAKSWTGSHQTSTSERHKVLSQSDTRFPTHIPSSSVTLCTEDQDQPLSFDKTRLAVAAAAFRGSSVHLGSSQAQSLAQVLQSGLPNLVNSASGQRFSIQISDSLGIRENNDKLTKESAYGQKDAALEQKSDCDPEERNPEESLSSGMIKEKAGHLLGLDCYSSSDEEFDTLHQKM
uniref:Uncharacterized LOC115418716 n=1 Tax=Sphaeramia orbicularis TaxID=375764 RepID=A0A673A0G6_9TELE